MTVNQAGILNLIPVITSNGGGDTAAITVSENATTAVTTVAAFDSDVLTYSIVGGADALRFNINASTGVLSFIAAPNFEAPTDAGANNVYDVIVKATDGIASDTQAIAVTVQNVNEAMTGELRMTSYAVAASNATASLTATNTIADPDVLSLAATYQWQQLTGATWNNVVGATNATIAGQSNATIRVVSTYTDAFGTTTTIAPETAIIGTSGNDAAIAGTAGVDYQIGLAGNDTLLASAGDDKVDGGIGTDTYSLAATAADATINLATGTSSSAATGNDLLFGIENLIASAGNDIIRDSSVANNLQGGNGNDTFIMSVDNTRDTITGGGGTDTADYSAFTTNLSVNLGTLILPTTVTGSGTTAATSDQLGDNIENFIGGSGADSITGTTGSNILVGGAGADTITGGQGADTLTGGLGADKFVISAVQLLGLSTYDTGTTAATRDVITDFVSGVDKIDFSGIDSNYTGVFDFSNGTFSALTFGTTFTAANQLRYHYEGVGVNEITVIEGNVNANLAADFQIALIGHITFVAADIIL
jgi:Ca2+-binding RTX toxin-like protein